MLLKIKHTTQSTICAAAKTVLCAYGLYTQNRSISLTGDFRSEGKAWHQQQQQCYSPSLHQGIPWGLHNSWRHDNREHRRFNNDEIKQAISHPVEIHGSLLHCSLLTNILNQNATQKSIMHRVYSARYGSEQVVAMMPSTGWLRTKWRKYKN